MIYFCHCSSCSILYSTTWLSSEYLEYLRHEIRRKENPPFLSVKATSSSTLGTKDAVEPFVCVIRPRLLSVSAICPQSISSDICMFAAESQRNTSHCGGIILSGLPFPRSVSCQCQADNKKKASSGHTRIKVFSFTGQAITSNPE